MDSNLTARELRYIEKKETQNSPTIQAVKDWLVSELIFKFYIIKSK